MAAELVGSHWVGRLRVGSRCARLEDTVGRLLPAAFCALGLRFAAGDFSVDHSGVWWHLEVNPAGQWAWDHPLRDAIASAIADALTGEITPP